MKIYCHIPLKVSIDNKLLDSLVLPSMLTASPSPFFVLTLRVTLYSEYGAKKIKKMPT